MLQGTGVDMAKWNNCFDNEESLPAVQAQIADGTSAGVDGTPVVFINGCAVKGGQPYEVYERLINEELAHR